MRHKSSPGIAAATDVTPVPRPGGVTVYKKIALAGTLLVLLLTLLLVLGLRGIGRHLPRALLYRVVKHARGYDVVRGHHRTLVVVHHAASSG